MISNEIVTPWSKTMLKLLKGVKLTMSNVREMPGKELSTAFDGKYDDLRNMSKNQLRNFYVLNKHNGHYKVLKGNSKKNPVSISKNIKDHANRILYARNRLISEFNLDIFNRSQQKRHIKHNRNTCKASCCIVKTEYVKDLMPVTSIS